MIGCTYQVLVGDARARLAEMPEESVHCVATSPPYWRLRDYGVAGQLGSEATPEEYVEKMVAVFREVRRVLRSDGVLFLNMGDSYVTRPNGSVGTKSTLQGSLAPHAEYRRAHAKRSGATPPGLKHKDLVGMPWRLALALQADGWWLRTDIIWSKPNCQPEAVEDRPTRSHEYIFLLTKSADYFYDPEPVREPTTGNAHLRGGGMHKKSAAARPGTKQNVSFSAAVTGLVEKRNLRTVWTLQTQANPEAHFATFPEALPRLCILAGTSEMGCCARCSAPYARLVEKRRTVDGEPAELPSMKDQDKGSPDTAQGIGHWRITTVTQTIGWTATCVCALGPPVPCLVLDPFSGTATTGRVALALGRSFIGVELNPEYAAISERLLAGTNPLFTRKAGA